MPTDAAKLEVKPATLRNCRACVEQIEILSPPGISRDQLDRPGAAIGPSTRTDAPMSRME